jgi:signal transduction histidine kinase
VKARTQIYLLLGLPGGLLGLAFAATYFGGIVGEFVPISVLSIVVVQLLLRPIGRLERSLAGSLLGQPVPAPEPLRVSRAAGVPALLRRVVAAFTDRHSWRVLAWLLVRIVAGPLGFAAVAGRFALAVVLPLAPVAVLVDTASDAVSVGLAGRYWLLLAPAGLAALPALRRGATALAGLHRRLAVWALGPGRDEIAAALARAAQAEEQVRIDQELHDSIGHMLSMIVVQAGAGSHVFDRDPDFARRALGTIEQRGRAALGELDRILSQIQEGRGGGYTPLPDADSLPELIAGAREAGVEVVARIRTGELPAPLGRGVYRIVQEALTNAAKHAPGRAVVVDVAAGAEAVAVRVTNGMDGTAPAQVRSAGRGLASIRDRAALLGGVAAIGLAGGEFVVTAVLPRDASLPDGAATQCTLTAGCACLGCTIRRRELR